jgi:hypothetical protein
MDQIMCPQKEAPFEAWELGNNLHQREEEKDGREYLAL